MSTILEADASYNPKMHTKKLELLEQGFRRAKSLAVSYRANRCHGIQERAWRGELERLVFLHKPLSSSLRSAASQSPSLSRPELACTEALGQGRLGFLPLGRIGRILTFLHDEIWLEW